MPAELQVLNGELQWKRVRMAGPRCLIGRRDDCHIVLKDAWVSREHTLVIETAPGEWMVQDLDSENGSFVNGARITESPLRHLDVLRVGRTEMRFTSASGRAEGETSAPPERIHGGAAPIQQPTPAAPSAGDPPLSEVPIPIGEQTVLDRRSQGPEGTPRGDLRERIRRLERLLLEKEEENSRLASENAVFKRALAAGGFFDPETGRFEIERLSTPGPMPLMPDGLLRFVANPLARLTYPLVEGGRLDSGEARGEPDGAVGVFRVGVVGLGDSGGRVAHAFHRIGYRHVLVLDTERTSIEHPGSAPRVTIGDGDVDPPEAWARQIAGAELRVQAAFRELLGTDLTLTLLAFSLASRLGVGSVASVRSVLEDYEDLSRGAAPERSQVGALVLLPSREALENGEVAERVRRGADQLRKLLDAGRLSPVMLIDEQALAELVSADVDEAHDERGQALASALDLLHRLPALAPLTGNLDPRALGNALSGGGISTLGLGATSRTDEESLSQTVRHAFGEGLLFRGVPVSRARTAVVLAQIGSEVPEGEAAVVRRLESSVAEVRGILPQAAVATGIYRDDGQGVRVLGFVGGLPTPEFLV